MGKVTKIREDEYIALTCDKCKERLVVQTFEVGMPKARIPLKCNIICPVCGEYAPGTLTLDRKVLKS